MLASYSRLLTGWEQADRSTNPNPTPYAIHRWSSGPAEEGLGFVLPVQRQTSVERTELKGISCSSVVRPCVRLFWTRFRQTARNSRLSNSDRQIEEALALALFPLSECWFQNLSGLFLVIVCSVLSADNEVNPRYDSGRTHPYHPKLRPPFFL
jgi:hypothetical protein